MISKEERMYYVDPIQPATPRRLSANGNPLDLEVFALRYRRDGFKQDRVGTIVPVTHQRVDAHELWWVDADGDYVYGAQVADRITGRGDVMVIVSDDLFYVGRSSGEHNLGAGRYGTVVTTVVRSDGKKLMGQHHANFSMLSERVVKAAPWARELMPATGDTQEVVDAKVLRAKQNYIQRQRKGEIYKEGMRRDWLHHLATLRPDHDMPVPTFNVGVEGVYLPLSSDTIPLTELSEQQRSRLTPVQRNTVIRPDSRPAEDAVHQYVGVPFAVVTGNTVRDGEEMHRLTSNDVRYTVFDQLRVSSGHVMESYRFAILTSF
jgi:hypothetical protein